jgi:magnesium chelatase subunit I
MEIAQTITSQEAKLAEEQENKIEVPEMMKILMERISFQARESEYIDEKSGVSARLSISGYENLVSTAERRMLINNDKKTRVRITDFWGVVPAITGKVELVYEGEQEGPYNVAMKLMSAAIKDEFMVTFPNPEKLKKGQMSDPYGTIRAWFSGGNEVDFLNDMGEKEFKKEIEKVTGLKKFVEQFGLPKEELHTYMELVLHGLASFNILSKDYLESKMSFADPLASMFDDDEDDEPFGNFN